MKLRFLFICLIVLAFATAGCRHQLIKPSWNPKQAGDRVMAGLIKVTSPQVKGAHDADLVIANDRAFIIAMVNDEQSGESAKWPIIYVTLSIVDMKTMTVEKIIRVARGGQLYDNEILPLGACFVPRIVQKDDSTLRCFFTSEEPGKRQSQVWFIDFNLDRMTLENSIHRAKLKTSAGTFDMQPRYFYADAAAHGFTKPPTDYGLYMIDSFKVFDGTAYAVVNNYIGRQNALAVLNDAMDTFEILGHYNEPQTFDLSESSVNRMPDGSWMAICRRQDGDRNYTFTTSPDGRNWTENVFRDFVPNGTSSKPTFDRFDGMYYLGWQESTRISGVTRSVFNIDISTDCTSWTRKYRFESERSFQYPTFRKYKGAIYFTVTQGDSAPSRKEYIMFGKLE